MCGMEFKENKVNVYNNEGYVMESMTKREHVQEVIDFLEECKGQMEQKVRLGEMSKLKKKKTRKAIARRAKAFEKYRVENAWRNIFVQVGILK